MHPSAFFLAVCVLVESMTAEELVPHALRGGIIGTEVLPVFFRPGADPGSAVYVEQRPFLGYFLYRDHIDYRKREKTSGYLEDVQDEWS